ncbi:hypothetical protein [Streptomyces sp. NPDC001089]
MKPEHAAAEARLQAALLAALVAADDDGWSLPAEPQRHVTAFLMHDSGRWAMFLPVPEINLIALIAGDSDGRPRQAEYYLPELDRVTDLYEWMVTSDLTDAAEVMAASVKNVLAPPG